MHHDVVEIHPETSIDRTPDPAGARDPRRCRPLIA